MGHEVGIVLQSVLFLILDHFLGLDRQGATYTVDKFAVKHHFKKELNCM